MAPEEHNEAEPAAAAPASSSAGQDVLMAVPAERVSKPDVSIIRRAAVRLRAGPREIRLWCPANKNIQLAGSKVPACRQLRMDLAKP